MREGEGREGKGRVGWSFLLSVRWLDPRCILPMTPKPCSGGWSTSMSIRVATIVNFGCSFHPYSHTADMIHSTLVKTLTVSHLVRISALRSAMDSLLDCEPPREQPRHQPNVDHAASSLSRPLLSREKTER
jgi:hypothetical protein